MLFEWKIRKNIGFLVSKGLPILLEAVVTFMIVPLLFVVYLRICKSVLKVLGYLEIPLT